MDKQQLTKQEIEERIKVLENYINAPTHETMVGTAKNEKIYYEDLLIELEESIYSTIQNDCPYQIYQQIGILI